MFEIMSLGALGFAGALVWQMYKRHQSEIARVVSDVRLELAQAVIRGLQRASKGHTDEIALWAARVARLETHLAKTPEGNANLLRDLGGVPPAPADRGGTDGAVPPGAPGADGAL